MRQITLLLDAGEQGFHPADIALREEPSVTRKHIHYLNILEEDTFVTLYEVQGNLERAIEILEERPDVYNVDAAGERDGFIFAHLEAAEPDLALTKILDQKEILIEYPIVYTKQGVEIKLAGTSEAIQEATSEISERVHTELVNRGEFRPTIEQLQETLTSRQQEVLELAVAMGYFEFPRETNYEEIAEELGVNQSTVAEHIQRIEAKILTQFVTQV